jgi:hypothetical protein
MLWRKKGRHYPFIRLKKRQLTNKQNSAYIFINLVVRPSARLVAGFRVRSSSFEPVEEIKTNRQKC